MNISQTSQLRQYTSQNLKLVRASDPVLSEEAKPVDPQDENLTDLFYKMEDVMYDKGGCGLAAPQVGIPHRMMIVDAGDGPVHLANPEITERSGNIPSLEGCLSLKGSMSLVMRSRKVTVKAHDEYGEPFTMNCSGFKALAMQHELDHLDGKLMTERAVANLTPARLLGGLAGFAAGAALRGTSGALLGAAAGVATVWGAGKLLEF